MVNINLKSNHSLAVIMIIHALTRLCLVLTGSASAALYGSQSALPGEGLRSTGPNSTHNMRN